MGRVNVYLPDRLEAEYRAAVERGEIEGVSNVLQTALEERLRQANPGRKLSFEERLRRIEERLEEEDQRHCAGCNCIHEACGYVVNSQGCVESHCHTPSGT